MGATKGTGKLRIIAGEWRGRKLPVAELPGLRPSSDRTRETLFNWLTPDIGGARCLDLFAGTGALGLEALSRGAAQCLFVERHKQAAGLLEQSLATLNALSRGTVHHGDALTFLRAAQTSPQTPISRASVDLVFLDPPFAEDLLDTAVALLHKSAVLSENALVYVECAAHQEPQVPKTWEPYRQKKSAGTVYGLYRV